jgi:hypothetical protein
MVDPPRVYPAVGACGASKPSRLDGTGIYALVIQHLPSSRIPTHPGLAPRGAATVEGPVAG